MIAESHSKSPSWTFVGALVVVAVTLPIGAWFTLPYVPPMRETPAVHRADVALPRAENGWDQIHLGDEAKQPARITNVQIVDFNIDGRNDVVACDARRGRVLLYEQTSDNKWREQVLNKAQELPAPAHATVLDLDGDKDLDVIVSVLGSVWPTDERIGRVVWLENMGNGTFDQHIILDDVRRVADVQGGDFDKDGDVDLIVAEFGYLHGAVWYLRNNGKQQFREKLLHTAPGTIHVPVADYDGDGDLDVAAVVSQDDEEVIVFENTGEAEFSPKKRRLLARWNFDFGCSGLVAVDLDKDGDKDLLLTAGDNLELMHNHPQPWHGVYWMENKGKWQFETRRLATFGGTYGAAPGDVDGDGDLDIIAVSQFNDWIQKDSASVVLLENDGSQSFTMKLVSTSPIHLATVAAGDLNKDGRADFVVGGFHLLPPFERMGRIAAWLSK